MQLFIDSANPQEVEEMASLGIIDGVTTNPSLVGKAGVTYQEAVTRILKVVKDNVSLEVLAIDAKGMVAEGKKLAALGKNVVVKLPTTEEGLKALTILNKAGIRVNMTLVFSANQALLAGKLGAYFVSPFIGRLDDIGQTGMDLIDEIKVIYNNYDIKTKILVASVRNPIHVKDAALIGADIATCPYTVLKQLVKHPLTDAGIDKFLEDFAKSGQKPLV
jgi:transaldolase